MHSVSTGIVDRGSWIVGLRAGALLAVVALVPLLILPGVFFYYDITPKILVLLIGVAFALAWGWPVAPQRRWLDVLLAGQAILLVAATAFSTDRALSFTGANWRRFGLVTQLALLLCVYLLSFERKQRILRAIALSGSLAALYGIAQYFGWDPWNPKKGYFIGEGIWTIVRPPGPLGHAGYFAVYLLHVVFAGAALAWGEEQRAWRAWGAAAAALGGAAVLLSGSRGAMLGLAAGLVTLGVRRRPRVTPRRVLIAATMLAGVVVVVFYFSPAGLPLRARTRWYREDPGGGGRLTLWADTLRMASAGGRWLAGYGPETYSSQFPRFQSEALARAYPERYYESPHNIFLDALAGQGLFGLAALAAFAGFGLWAARGNHALSAGLVASLVANQFLAFIVPTALLFYVAVVLCAPETARFRSRPGIGIPVAIVMLAAALALGWSDYGLARTRAALEAGEVDRAIESYGRLRRWAPPGLDTDLWYSRALAAIHSTSPLAWQEAYAAAGRASATSEQRPNAWYNLAAFCALQNDFARTEQSLRQAIDWAPQWFKPHWMLARVLYQAGRLAEAEAEARRAVELNGGKNREVADTWAQIRAAPQK
ncbi:MAG: O-antigen ligase family protein [Acidobacteria bacterium]|nr:O-antigen ligase family protein [Acidobacteriota bacterium]